MEYLAIVFAVLVYAVTEKKKVGGIWFWKLGRIGGSFYIKAPRTSSGDSRMIPEGTAGENKVDILVDRHLRMSYNRD